MYIEKMFTVVSQDKDIDEIFFDNMHYQDFPTEKLSDREATRTKKLLDREATREVLDRFLNRAFEEGRKFWIGFTTNRAFEEGRKVGPRL